GPWCSATATWWTPAWPRRSRCWRPASDRSPVPAMHDVVHRLALPARRRALRAPGLGVPDGDHPGGLPLLRHAELVPEGGAASGVDPEEARAEALVHGGLQHEQRGHAGVDVPVRHRPARLVPVGPALV